MDTSLGPMHSPAHPGALIRETLEGIREETGTKLTIEQAAEALGTSRKHLSAILNGKASISPDMAVKLGYAFDNTTAEFWLGVQEDYDLAEARKRIRPEQVRKLWVSPPLAA